MSLTIPLIAADGARSAVTVADPVVASSYPDGSANAPAGSPQRPTILNGYAKRPPWKVAGVDYAVGPNSAPTRDPTTIPVSGSISRSGTRITVSGTDAVLDGYDLTSGSGWEVVLTGVRAKMTNCHIKAINSDHAVIVHGVDCQVNYNIIDGNKTASFPLRFNNSTGTGIFTYNYIFGSQSDMIYVDNTSNSTHTNITAKFNLIDGGGSVAGAHADLWQTGSGTFDDIEILFNTWYVNSPVQGTQGINMCDGAAGSINNVVNVKNNTGISKGATGAMGFFIGGQGGGVIVNGPCTSSQNYFDPTATTGSGDQLYSRGTIGIFTSSKGNVNMLTGQIDPAWNN